MSKPKIDTAIRGTGYLPCELTEIPGLETCLWLHDTLSSCVMFAREGNSPDHHTTITYRQLLSQVCRCANVLKQMGEALKSPSAKHQRNNSKQH